MSLATRICALSALAFVGIVLAVHALTPGRAPDLKPSAGASLGFADLDRVCGDLAAPTFLCLLNPEAPETAKGVRRVITGDQAEFEARTSFNNGVVISVRGKDTYDLAFAPPKGKGLIPGLYTGSERYPFNKGPAPGINLTVDSLMCHDQGRFRIVRFDLKATGEVRRLVADFEVPCGRDHTLTVGRIAVGDVFPRKPPVGVQPPPPTRSEAKGVPDGPSSPGVSLGFDDLDKACGDLNRPSFVCLVNQGSEPAAGGARRVLADDQATFNIGPFYGGAVSVDVQAALPHHLDFGPPRGRGLLPGLYTGAERVPAMGSPAPWFEFRGPWGCSGGRSRFRILRLELKPDGDVRRFVADFETACGGGARARGTIGRLAVGNDDSKPVSASRQSSSGPAPQADLDEPSSPGVVLGFKDLDKACGNLADASFLCMVNEGTEPAAGGARRVLAKPRATLRSWMQAGDSFEIQVAGKRADYTFGFAPPVGASLAPGDYAQTLRFRQGPSAGLDVSGCNEVEGQFRILELRRDQGKIVDFVADFDGDCDHGAHRIGRIALRTGLQNPAPSTERTR
jgi:hypothetical protein